MQEFQEMQFRSLGWEDPLEEGMATQSSILDWRIPWTEEPGGLQSTGLQRVRCDWSMHACINHTHTSNKEHTSASDCQVLKFSPGTKQLIIRNICSRTSAIQSPGKASKISWPMSSKQKLTVLIAVRFTTCVTANIRDRHCFRVWGRLRVRRTYAREA